MLPHAKKKKKQGTKKLIKSLTLPVIILPQKQCVEFLFRGKKGEINETERPVKQHTALIQRFQREQKATHSTKERYQLITTGILNMSLV